MLLRAFWRRQGAGERGNKREWGRRKGHGAHLLVAGGSAVAVVGASVAATSVTFSPASLSQPKFEGLLSQAAYIADLGQGKVIDYQSYRDTLAEFVGQVSALYIAADSLPVGLDQENLITVLHVSDIHDNPQAYDVIEQLHTQFAIDVVIAVGDVGDRNVDSAAAVPDNGIWSD